jgi:hypothetical protein
MPSVKKWEMKSDAEKIEQLQNELGEAFLAIKNLTHDVGRIAARLTTAELSLKTLVESSTQTKAKPSNKK